jgi:hypothetical protein
MRVAAGAGVRKVDGGRVVVVVVGVGIGICINVGVGVAVGNGIPIGTDTRLGLLPAIRTVPHGALGRQMLPTNTGEMEVLLLTILSVVASNHHTQADAVTLAISWLQRVDRLLFTLVAAVECELAALPNLGVVFRSGRKRISVAGSGKSVAECNRRPSLGSLTHCSGTRRFARGHWQKRTICA